MEILLKILHTFIRYRTKKAKHKNGKVEEKLIDFIC